MIDNTTRDAIAVDLDQAARGILGVVEKVDQNRDQINRAMLMQLLGLMELAASAISQTAYYWHKNFTLPGDGGPSVPDSALPDPNNVLPFNPEERSR